MNLDLHGAAATEASVVPAAPVATRSIDLDEVGGALAVCDSAGHVTGCSPSGRSLLSRMGMSGDTSLPIGLWTQLVRREVGTAVQWRSTGREELVLGCTRYALGPEGAPASGSEAWLLIMSEISQKQNALAQRLHQQRLESLGRLVATTAHDLRSPLSSIVFNSDVLVARIDELPPERVREAVGDIKIAATRLRGTIDCLLDYTRIGPPQPTDVSLKEILARMHSLLRPLFRAGGHKLVDAVAPEAGRVLGNSLAVEQIFVNLVLNSIEAAAAPMTIRVSASPQGALLRILVADDGPGIRPEHRPQLFDPFFTTKPDGTGIGLSTAREAARAAGGDVQLADSSAGAAFVVFLPAAKRPEDDR